MKKNQSLIRGQLAKSMLELTPFTIFKSGQYIEQKFAELFIIPPMKLRHYACLRVLIHGEARTQQELSEALWIDRGTMTGLVKDLLKMKMLKRVFHKEDRRSYILSLTDSGEKFYLAHAKNFEDLERKIFKNLSSKDLTTVQQILSRALSSLCEKA